VDGVPRTDENGVRTATQRLRAAHRRMDPELPRLVVRRRDNPSPVRVAADHQRLRPERGILELFDRGEEGIEVEMRDDHAESLDPGPPGAPSPSAISSSYTHAHARARARARGPTRVGVSRSEERRVGKECRTRWFPGHL